MPDGTVCHYLPDGTTDVNGHPIWTLRDCSDSFGNTVTLARGTDPADGTPIQTITQSLGNGQSREIVWRLNPDGNPSSMRYGDRVWQYQYVAAYGMHDLQTVMTPTGVGWTFAYDSPTAGTEDGGAVRDGVWLAAAKLGKVRN